MGRAPGARQAAFRILLEVETAEGHSGALLRGLPATMDRRERALATELVLGTLRWQGRLDHALAQCSHRPLEQVDPPLRVALRMAAHQILELERIPDSAAVNEAVRLVRRRSGRGGGGFVNAVLRGLLRARDAGALRWPGADRPLAERLSVLTSHPLWLVRRVVERLGPEEGEQALRAQNRAAPLTLRTNRQRLDAAELRTRLQAEGVHTEAGRWAPSALRVLSGQPIETRAFREGWFYVQDEASMLVADLVGARAGERIADLCAAPGGKAIELAAAVETSGLVVASDVHLRRLRLVRENAMRMRTDRLGLLLQDGGQPALRPASFDRVLVDAPCTGTGVLRRRPEIRWRRRPEDVGRMAGLQRRLLEAAAEIVRPGGVVAYSVCSLEPEEGLLLVRDFLAARSDFEAEPPAGVPPALVQPGAGLPHLATLPHRHDLDGFFAAVLRRRSLP